MPPLQPCHSSMTDKYLRVLYPVFACNVCASPPHVVTQRIIVGGNQFLSSAVKPLGRKPKGQTNDFNESLLEHIEFYFLGGLGISVGSFGLVACNAGSSEVAV